MEIENKAGIENNNNEVIQSLELEYRKALAAFKADKSNKDLRRLKSAAKQAWDREVALSQDGEPLTCRNCSQQFIFTVDEQNHFANMGWDSTPTKCPSCVSSEKEKREDRSNRDNKIKNMCYAFQRGTCQYGNKCKFSHDPRGKKKDEENKEESDGKEEKKIITQIAKCKWGKKCTIKKCRYSHDDDDDDDDDDDGNDETMVTRTGESSSQACRNKKRVRKAILKSLKKAPNEQLKMKELCNLVKSYMKEKNKEIEKSELKLIVRSVLESNDKSKLVIDGKVVKLLKV